MEVSARFEGELSVIRVEEPRIDAQVALVFKEMMRQKARASSAVIILDLSKVTFIDSSGLGAIVATMKTLAPEQKLVLAGFTVTVEKVFRLTRMDQVFDLFPTVEEAVLAFHD